MKFIFGFIFLLNQILALPKLSENAEFGVLTCAPGNELYSIFGHSAIHFSDPEYGIDWVYNYGVFSFDTDNFYYKFVKGETDYQLGKEPYDFFVSEYNYFGRNVYEHRLLLTQTQKQRLFEILETNYLPRNRKYRYVYLLDNCSTRIRDIMQKMFADSLSWNTNDSINLIPDNYSFADRIEASRQNPMTYRQILDMYLAKNLWNDFIIDLVLGLPIDDKADIWASMFIPDFLMMGLSHSTISDSEGIQRCILGEPQLRTMYFEPLPENDTEIATSPIVVFSIILIMILAISIFEIRNRRWFKPIDSALFAIYGLFGIVVWFISYISIHPGVFPNFNTFWLLPTHLLFAIIIYIKKCRKVVIYYSKAIIILSLIFLLTWIINLIPQTMNVANIMLILLPMVRALRIVLADLCDKNPEKYNLICKQK